MEPKSGRKPINVLTEYLTSWIRANSEEALPFDSFENLKPGRVAQKNVERWVFNCNYVYNRMGGIFYDRNIFPQDPGERAKLIRSLDRAFKSISDNTPLDLRSKPSESVPYELSKDWPPFTENSRNTLERFEDSLEQFRTENPAFCDQHADVLAAAEAEIREEASYYALIEEEVGDSSRAFVTTCRALLPIWCAKEINPLVTLLFWSDEDALAELIDELTASFSTQREFDASHARAIETWREATLQAQALYIDDLDDDADLTTLSVPEIGHLLASEDFSLDHGSSSEALPRWLLGKARLIWNVVICTVLGPEEAIGSALPDGSSTVESVYTARSSHCPSFLTGEVLLRRRYSSGRVVTIDRLMLDSVCSPGLWKVIGFHYDAHAPLPNSAYRTQFVTLGASFVASEVRDGTGKLIEGSGDSRFHLELAIEVDAHKHARVVARDLDSKNGTCVLRTSCTGFTCFAFPGRRHLDVDDWAERLGVSAEHVCLVDELTLERGDIIQLADSCFELI